MVCKKQATNVKYSRGASQKRISNSRESGCLLGYVDGAGGQRNNKEGDEGLEEVKYANDGLAALPLV